MADHQPEGLSVRRLNWLPLLAGLMMLGCDPGPDTPDSDVSEPSETPTDTLGASDPALADTTLSAWQQGSQWLGETRSACDILHERLDSFLKEPTEDTLASTREAWHQCHRRWHRMEPLLALGESSPGLFGDLNEVAFRIAAHPIQPGYLDGLENYPYSGIVNDITLAINAQTLREQHGLTDEADVALGLHALEFLLWGEQGSRPVSDFEPRTSPGEDPMNAERTVDQLPNNRRRALIQLISQLLQDDLATLEQHWQSTSGRLPATYRQLSPASRLPLLRDAIRVLLLERLPRELAQITDREQAHNAFSGDSLSVIISAIEGVDQLLQAGEPALAQWLIPEPGQAEWLEQWRALTEAVNQSDAPDPEDLSGQLRALGEVLNSTVAPGMTTP